MLAIRTKYTGAAPRTRLRDIELKAWKKGMLLLVGIERGGKEKIGEGTSFYRRHGVFGCGACIALYVHAYVSLIYFAKVRRKIKNKGKYSMSAWCWKEVSRNEIFSAASEVGEKKKDYLRYNTLPLSCRRTERKWINSQHLIIPSL